jgi:murein DD-endopeptidase MepM/ murein hydrolase activator NlpD
MVLLRHGDGYFTRYAHLRAVEVRLGDPVNALQEIGIVGDTGRATTAHLHFEILTPERRPIDPAPRLFQVQIARHEAEAVARGANFRSHQPPSRSRVVNQQ